MIRKYHFVAAWFSFLSIFKQCLGDVVKVDGQWKSIINGTRHNSWLVDFKDGKEVWVRRSDCKKRMLPKDMVFSFIKTWNFYKTSWFSIWEDKGGVCNFSKSCNIWGGFEWKKPGDIK